MALFNRRLRDTSVVAVILHARSRQRRVMAGVPKDRSPQGTVGSLDAKYVHGSIDRTKRNKRDATIGCKGSLIAPIGELRGT